VSFGFDGDAKIETCYRIISRGSTPHRISAIPVGGYKQEQISLQKQPVTTIHYADVNSPARFSCPQDPIGIIGIFGKESNGIKPLRFNILNHCDNPIELVECVNRISMQDSHLSSILAAVPHVYVWRIVVVELHLDDDAQEPAELWHGDLAD
jgi:hypothetical protein